MMSELGKKKFVDPSRPSITKVTASDGTNYLVMPHLHGSPQKTGVIVKPATADKVRLRIEKRQMERMVVQNLSNTQRKKLGLKAK